MENLIDSDSPDSLVLSILALVFASEDSELKAVPHCFEEYLQLVARIRTALTGQHDSNHPIHRLMLVVGRNSGLQFYLNALISRKYSGSNINCFATASFNERSASREPSSSKVDQLRTCLIECEKAIYRQREGVDEQ